MATISSLSSLLPDVVGELPGCPSPLIARHASKMLRDFCEKTQSWVLEITKNIVKDTTEYDLTGDLDTANSQIVSVISLAVNGVVQTLGTDCTIAGNVVTLESTPNSDITDGLVIAVALEPVRGGVSIEETVITRYGDGIADGVKASLMAMPGQSWANPQMSGYYSREYQRTIRRARIAQSRGNMNTNLTARPTYGFI